MQIMGLLFSAAVPRIAPFLLKDCAALGKWVLLKDCAALGKWAHTGTKLRDGVHRQCCHTNWDFYLFESGGAPMATSVSGTAVDRLGPDQPKGAVGCGLDSAAFALRKGRGDAAY